MVPRYIAPALGLHRAEARALSNDRSGHTRASKAKGLVNVPLLDLVAQYRTIKDDVLAAMMAVIERQAFIMGPEVAQLGGNARAIDAIASLVKDASVIPVSDADVLGSETLLSRTAVAAA